MKNRVIAIVEDDRICRLVVRKQIESNPSVQHVLEFSNGSEALEYLHKNISKIDAIPDLIFLDLTMPLLDGWTFLERINSILPKMQVQPHIYILTSSTDEMDKLRAEKIKIVSGFITKPVKLRTIERIIHNLVEGRIKAA